jgi:Mrp family chromosome partitioning ATPase
MEFWLYVEHGRIVRATFTTDGCGHSILSGSACARLAESKALEEAMGIEQEEILDAVGGLPEESRHCALLAVDALKAAVADSMRRRTPREETKGDPAREHDEMDGRGARPPRTKEKAAANFEASQALRRRLGRIRHKILVLSGKGGVGKSTVAVNLAVSLLLSGKRVGLLDVDLHGPTVPKMLKLEGAGVESRGGALLPVVKAGLKVMSIGFLLSRPDDAIIWRGPMKMHVIEQFLGDVEWGDLDYLVIDSPPGTGDEPLSVCQLVDDADGAVIVTTPQDVATANVRRSIRFCQDLRLPVLGVVENMSGFVCPACGTVTPVFGSGGGERMAAEMGVPFLGRIPLDPALTEAGDGGLPFSHHHGRTATGRALEQVLAPLLGLSERPLAEPKREKGG